MVISLFQSDGTAFIKLTSGLANCLIYDVNYMSFWLITINLYFVNLLQLQ